MSLTKTVSLFAGTTLALTGVAFGSTEANNSLNGDALAQINELRAEIADLKARNGENWLTEQRAAEIKGLVQDVLADADTRASLQGGGSTAGYDNGFFIASSDGNFRLNINGGASLRWSINNRDFVGAGEQTNWGFQSRHANVMLTGHIVDPSWKYNVSFGFFDASGDYTGSTAGEAFLTDWYAMKDFGGWYLKAGQFVAPFSRERALSDYGLQTLDHTNSSYVFGLGRTQGLEVGCIGDWFRSAVSFSDGVSATSVTQNNGYLGGAGGSSPASDFAITGRVEGKLAGTWAQFEDDQAWRGEEFGLLIGLGGFYQSGHTGDSRFNFGSTGPAGALTGSEGSEFGFTADATASWSGFSVTGALFYNQADSEWVTTAGGAGDFESYGAFVQAGFFLTDEFELVARYEYGDVGNIAALESANTQSTISFGANYYFAKNRCKWQTEVAYALHSVGTFEVAGNGWYDDGSDINGNDEDGQLVFRTGLTVSF